MSSSLSLSSWNSWLSRDFLEPMEVSRISSSYSSLCWRRRWKPSFCLLDLTEHTHQMMQAVIARAVIAAAETEKQHQDIKQPYAKHLLSVPVCCLQICFSNTFINYPSAFASYLQMPPLTLAVNQRCGCPYQTQ